ncbi:MAG TPA: VWA domain-containing protein [Polyangiaceae bacterium]|jgi:hypothetical protein|nr:MAG: hypothetical protein BWY17_01226 [Deltaproteobacteria bacterium ADurb.Bin207]HNS97197.1 VWA domain-containing protein [Polyangiaceae bacterium]HNZ21296.1 VWA domain-containing protein [Polyangiaceae bacterium]HOD21019.1 VWA domain-containing protein [Polyangiaceae bacterium]HOE48683.1 VWA domain-containing protein [Polyangiaceae bacterium]
MEFLGLPLTTLLSIGAGAGALVVVAYILRLKRRPVPVHFVKLWERILREKEATSLFSQLKRILSLLLQLLLLTLLIFALGDPRSAAAIIEGRNLVVLIDASASMQATDGTPTRFESARQQARDLVRGMGGSDRALIVQMDATVTPLSTMTDEIPVLESAISSTRVTESRADFPRALRFALDSLVGLSNPEVVVISDGRLGVSQDAISLPLGEVKLSYVKVGQRDINAAITQFSVRRYPLDKSRYEVMIEVSNTSKEPLELELSLYGDDTLVDLTKFRVGPGENLPRFYPNLSGASRSLEARLTLANGERDTLPVDDHAYALLPERRRARIQCVTKGNTYLEAALLLDEYLDVTLVDPASYPVLGQQYDVTIFDNVTPDVAPGSGALFYVNPDGDRSPVKVGKGSLEGVGFDTWDKKSPLLRWTTIQNVNIATARKLEPKQEDKVIGASFDGPLLVMGRRAGKPFVAMGFDVRDSDLPLRISWPLLLLNTINEFVNEDTSYISSYRTGTLWRIPVAVDVSEANLETPWGAKQTIPVLQGHAVYLGQSAGVYRMTAGPPDASVQVAFAANLSDVQESTIAPLDSLEVAGKVAGPVEGFRVGVRREFWIYLLLGVVALTTIEWITYHRRITV